MDVIQGPATESHIDHGTYQHADHVMEKPVGLDMEAYAVAIGPRLPVCEQESATVVGFVTLGGKCAEIVLSLDCACTRDQRIEIE